LPPFAIFSNDKYIFKPTNPSRDIGSFTIKGSLSDTKLSTDFVFGVQVVNDPPYFKQALRDQRVVLGDTWTYELPMTEDKELLPVSIKATVKSEVLPPFIKLQAGIFTFSPVDVKHAGNYQIEVALSDGFANPKLYQFKLAVIDPSKSLRPRVDLNDAGNFTVTKAALRIVSVGRDGKVKLKVISSEKMADDIIRGITNVSFSITVPTKNNEQVPYKVDFRDISGMSVTI
jgi:hypothetical protein